MYIEKIEYRREKDSEWEKGYYVGRSENSDHASILDSNYQALPKKINGWEIYDYRADTDNRLIINFSEDSTPNGDTLNKMGSFTE